MAMLNNRKIENRIRNTGLLFKLLAVTAISLHLSCTVNPFQPEKPCLQVPDYYEDVQVAKEVLVLNKMFPDTVDSVVGDIYLPDTGKRGTTIWWISGDNSRITADGTVNRPPAGSGDDTITLLAVISKGIYSFVRVFTLIIVQNTEELDVAYDLKTLRVIYAPEDSAGSVTRDIMLPTSGKNGCSIVWEAEKPTIVNESGAVTSPEFGCGDDTVILRARVSKGEFTDFKVYTLTVKEKLESMLDNDGNLYQTIKIGSQVWAMEDLRTTKYNDGTPIPYVADTAEWSALTGPGYCHQFNRTYVECGLLYNWYAVNTGKLAPSGWHVPDEADWDTLRNYLITHGYNWDGSRTGNKIAKSMASKEAWPEITEKGAVGCDVASNNCSGFSAVQVRSHDEENRPVIGGYSHWWCASEHDSATATVRWLTYYRESLEEGAFYKRQGLAVRLVKD